VDVVILNNYSIKVHVVILKCICMETGESAHR